MDKPTITPMRDAVMRMIPEIHDRCDQLVLSGSHPGDGRAVKHIVPEIMLAMANEMDLETSAPAVLSHMEAGIANAITSVARTIANREDWPLTELVEAFSTRIAERAMRLADMPDADISKVTQRIKRPKPRKGRGN